MPLCKGGLEAQIDRLVFPAAVYVCWQCVGLFNYEEVEVNL